MNLKIILVVDELAVKDEFPQFKQLEIYGAS